MAEDPGSITACLDAREARITTRIDSLEARLVSRFADAAVRLAILRVLTRLAQSG